MMNIIIIIIIINIINIITKISSAGSSKKENVFQITGTTPQAPTTQRKNKTSSEMQPTVLPLIMSLNEPDSNTASGRPFHAQN